MISTPTEATMSLRATAIARGVLRTERAVGIIHVEEETLRLACRGGGFYWIMLADARVYRGKTFIKADELQPKFIDAMARAGR